VGAVGLLAGCTPRAPEPDANLEQNPEEPFPLPDPITRDSSGLPARVLAPAGAPVAAPPLSLTASDGTGLKLVALRAEASVQEPLAHTQLHLVFDNPEDRTLEGRFTIDLPPRAAISRFAMLIDGRWQEGEIVERQAARVAYEDFLHRKQDPALMEKEAGNRFSARVFPIPARGRKELIVSYSQELGDSAEPYRLLLRGLPRLEQLDARILVDEPGAAGAKHRQTVEIHERDHTPDRDLEVSSFAPQRAVGIRNDDIALARVTAAGSTAPEPITDLTILFDTSASRALGFDGQVRRLGALVQALQAHAGDFTLRVAAFDQDVSLVFEGQASELGQEQLNALYTRRALGASDLASALRRVATVSGPGGRVLVLTDGVATAGDDELADLVSAAKSLEHVGVTRIDAIIDGGLQDRGVLQAITTAGLPHHGVVADAELPPAQLAGKLLLSTIGALEVSVEGSSWVWPRTLEGVQPGDELLVYANLPERAAMTVVLEGEDTIRVDVPLTTVDRPLLHRAWVGARIEAMQLERSELEPTDSEGRERLRAAIVELSTTQRVLSDFTALLVLETEYDYARFDITRRGLADILVAGPEGLEWLRRDLPKTGGEASPQRVGRFDVASSQTVDSYDVVGSASGAGILGAMTQDSGHFLASPYGGAFAVGNDDEDVWGGLTGTETGEAFGVGGMGLVGTGRGGGGTGEGTIGLGNTGLIGESGGGYGSGYGRGSGAGFGGRGKRVPQVRQGKATIKGTVDKDIVRRIVRAHVNEIRYCYNQGLARDPRLMGRVSIQFNIGPTGSVPVAVVAESTIKDPKVSTCIARAVKRWTFPKPPGGGSALVLYPFVLEPGEGKLVERELTPAERAAQAEAVRVFEAQERARLAEEERRRLEAERTAGSPYDGRMFDVMTALAANEQEPALALALQWHEQSPGDVLALLALGEVLERRGEANAAARAYGSLIDLFPARADLRRHAGSRLERLGAAGLDLAIDSHRHVVEQRPDHPSSHRMLAFALVGAGRYEAAFEALVTGLAQAYPLGRFEASDRILREDLGLVAAAWLHAEPLREAEIRIRVSAAGASIPTAPSTRFVMTWETDANDVDFHVYDGNGDHAYYRSTKLASGGLLYADVRNGYGPECFTIEGKPSAFPYRFEANYFSRGPMGYGMGALQILEHDGSGGLALEARPFVIMKDHADVKLGALQGPLAPDTKTGT